MPRQHLTWSSDVAHHVVEGLIGYVRRFHGRASEPMLKSSFTFVPLRLTPVDKDTELFIIGVVKHRVPRLTHDKDGEKLYSVFLPP